MEGGTLGGDPAAAEAADVPGADAPSVEAAGKPRTGLVGSLLVAYWLLDGLVFGIPVVLLSAYGRALIVFAVAAVVLVPLNIFFCRWINRHWDAWFSGNGKRIEGKLDKMRKSRLMRHPVAWMQRGSNGWFGLAAAVTNAITTVSLARMIGGEKLEDRRVLVAAVSYGVFCSALWALIGYLLGDVIRAA